MIKVSSPTASFHLPTSWEDITLKQFLDLSAAHTDRQILSCLVSDIDALHQLDAGDELRIVSHLDFLTTLPDFTTLLIPERIAGIVPPTEINVCPLIQKWSVDDWFTDMEAEGIDINPMTAAIPLLSVYLCPGLTGVTFTSVEQARAIRAQIEALSCLEAIPLSAFFLSSFSKPLPSGRSSFQKLSPRHPKSNRLKKWSMSWRAIGNWVRFRRWQASAD